MEVVDSLPDLTTVRGSLSAMVDRKSGECSRESLEHARYQQHSLSSSSSSAAPSSDLG